ncbi:MAG: [acyl-carrier-protein] S-malonyltransferase [Oceanospirillaceae bacterium]|nr:[acyl-carrier-protein] S-malonyltransferase [Oceanospirillaceae bacterium]MBT12406.1 [acyl-carrier-protein] S-malonyltransferase [Oceanospirillaceae bacterium]|tara:strand:- start:24472 stop:25410 length:939 start_codon:yes stop_codon:yes gene_type:complete
MTDVIAFFPGQGAQHTGMLKDLAADFPVVEETFREASEAINQDLWALAQDAPADELNLTYNTQPALLAASVAVWRVIKAQCPALNVVAAAGHSLGEYSALVAANALDFADAVRLVKKRGQLMDAAVPAGQGGMAAVLGLSEEQIADVCAAAADAGVVEPANFNAPGQIVIAGAMPAVEKAIELAKEAGAKRALPLAVSGPFHSSLMKAAAEEFGQALSQITFRAPEFPVHHNVDNKAATLEEIPARLLAQLYSPVNWTGAVESLRSAADVAVEFGPGKVLAGLNKRIDKTLTTVSTGDSRGVAAAIELIQGS